MVANRVKRLPVVDGERLVGIVTRSDLIRSYLRSDAEITVTVERAVRAVDGLQVVGVQDGVVKLGGTVASRALAGAIRHLVSEIDGVVAVDDGDLNWPDGWPSEVVRQ